MNGTRFPGEHGGGLPGDGTGCGPASGPPPRIPPPRGAADDTDHPLAAARGRLAEPPPPSPPYPHRVLKSLLGAWALAVCSADEKAAVEAHLRECPSCTEEAGRLRGAVGLLHPEDSLDLDPSLRTHVLEGCLTRRPARIPVPAWGTPYEAETARLDALLRDMAEDEWTAPVRLRWFDGRRPASRDTTVAGVIGHLTAVDGAVAGTLGLPDPLAPAGPFGTDGRELPRDPAGRTEEVWRGGGPLQQPVQARAPWREQSHALVRAASFASRETTEREVGYGDFALPLRDAFVERAFECWVHAGDIAEAIDYPYASPSGDNLHRMVDLAARLLPATLAGRRQCGLASPAGQLTAVGAPGRTLHLEIEGSGGGHWYIALDSPGAKPSEDGTVAHLAMDGPEFCQLAAGHIPPQDAAAGMDGDRGAVDEVLYAAASLSRL